MSESVVEPSAGDRRTGASSADKAGVTPGRMRLAARNSDKKAMTGARTVSLMAALHTSSFSLDPLVRPTRNGLA